MTTSITVVPANTAGKVKAEIARELLADDGGKADRSPAHELADRQNDEDRQQVLIGALHQEGTRKAFLSSTIDAV